MFDYIKGILVDKSYPYCTVECAGIGYRFLVNSRVLQALGELNSEVKVYAKLIHKEDSMTLCGFKSKQDKILFDIMIGVSGIGAKAALSLLEEFETNELINLIISQDYKTISRTKGIGPKTAQKLVLEIKDKLAKQNNIAYTPISNTAHVSSETISQTAAILESLGYTKEEYKAPLETAINGVEKDDEQELLKEVLKILSIF